MTEAIAIIPARGGSKSIPHKNIRQFAGYPLIAYSIAAGLASENVSRVIVSTDDQEIAAVSRFYGAETPFLRPADYAADNTPDLPVFQHALDWLAEHEGYQPEITVQLRPTSPLRRVWHIDQAVLRLLEHPEADSIRTICAPFQNPFKMWQIRPDGLIQPLIPAELILGEMGTVRTAETDSQVDPREPYNMPRQLLPEVYWQTGYVDAAWSDTILEKGSMTGDFILPLVIPPSDWIDIDSADDWRRAERMLESGEITFNDLGYQIKEY